MSTVNLVNLTALQDDDRKLIFLLNSVDASDVMDDLEKAIQELTFPIALPPGSIMVMGKRRIPNFDLILAQLPGQLAQLINPNATAPGGGADGYFIPLLDGRYLKIYLKDMEIISLSLVST